MRRWVRVLLGPLPATVLLLPVLFAGGLGAAIALAAGLLKPDRSLADRWAVVTTSGMVLGWVAAAGIGVLALWVAVLADAPIALRHAQNRWWLAAGLLLGLAAGCGWLWAMGLAGHGYGPLTWTVWLALLAGPIVMGIYYLVQLFRG
jgi:hypothetical protein